MDTPANATGNLTALSPHTSECGFPVDPHALIDVSTIPPIYVNIVVYPILLTLCTFGNVLNLIVLGSDTAKSSATVYLMCLAISDLFVLWLELPVYITVVNPSIVEQDSFYYSFGNFNPLRTWWSETCLQFSDWTLLVFSAERLLAIARPLKFLHKDAVRRTIFIEAGVFFLASLATVENAVSGYYTWVRDDPNKTRTEMSTPTLMKWDEVQNQSEVGITLGKFFMLLVINTAVMVLLYQHNKIRAIMLSTAKARDQQSLDPHPSHHQNRTSTIFLFACVILYLCTQFPNVVYKCLEIASTPPYCSYDFDLRSKETARPFIYVSVMANYSLNFFVYCALCKKFRIQLRWLQLRYQGRRQRRASTDTMLSTVGSSPQNGRLMLEDLEDVQDHPKLSMGKLSAAGANANRLQGKADREKELTIQND